MFCKNKHENFIEKESFAQNIHCEYTLEPTQRGVSNEYPQCMFGILNKKIRYALANPSCFYIIVGFKWVYIPRICFTDGQSLSLIIKNEEEK